uniref:Uncharacterized protein n=1 Tax=Timema monikensis TaxID=170555 RepID=A0A7R9HL19_9NEOP|nr:unnamed protein product [Timema monikensis]
MYRAPRCKERFPIPGYDVTIVLDCQMMTGRSGLTSRANVTVSLTIEYTSFVKCPYNTRHGTVQCQGETECLTTKWSTREDKVVDSKLLDTKKRHGPSDRHKLDHVINNQPVDKMKTIIWKAGWVKWPTRLGPTARQAQVKQGLIKGAF